MADMWPSLPFLAFGVWTAWSSLAYSGSIWLSDSEVDGTYLSWLYVFSTFSCAAVFLVAALTARRGSPRAIADNRVVMGASVAASAGCVLIILMGPYYLGPVFEVYGGANELVFWFGAILSGLGTGVVGLRCGVLYGMLSPRRALIYAALSQLVASFIYLVVFAFPQWQPIAHGPSLSGIVFFCGLPLVAAALSCVRPSKAVVVDERMLGQAGASVGVPFGTASGAPFGAPFGGSIGVSPCVPSPASPSASSPAPSPSPASSPAPSSSPLPADAASPSRLPAPFWRFAVFSFFMCLLTSMVRSTVVTTHALAATVDGNNLLLVFRSVLAILFIVYAVGASSSQLRLGKVCSLLATFSAVVTALIAAIGGLTNEWSLLVYFAGTVLELVMWCLLAFIVVQKRISAVVVFGFGRGAFLLGCAAGWMLGLLVMPMVPSGTVSTVLFVSMAGVMLLLALGLFSERDYERLFSPVSEEELSLEDLFDIERREGELAEERRSEKRGRFSRAIEAVAEEYGLSAREAEVLRCLAMGYGSDRIAGIMQVKVNTVRTHTHNVYVKLDVHSREELMRLVDDAVARQ